MNIYGRWRDVMCMKPVVDVHEVRARTVYWLEKAVIGLNLCPFAKAVHHKGLIHYVVTEAVALDAVRTALEEQIQELIAMKPQQRDTTLLIVPCALAEFWEFDWFVAEAQRWLKNMELDGVIQIAAFHPQFEFGDEPPGDITHATNQSPYPILHLLRESSVTMAVAAFEYADRIYDRNKATLRQLGAEGWRGVVDGFEMDSRLHEKKIT